MLTFIPGVIRKKTLGLEFLCAVPLRLWGKLHKEKLHSFSCSLFLQKRMFESALDVICCSLTSLLKTVCSHNQRRSQKVKRKWNLHCSESWLTCSSKCAAQTSKRKKTERAKKACMDGYLDKPGKCFWDPEGETPPDPGLRICAYRAGSSSRLFPWGRLRAGKPHLFWPD